jgi:hypothetical protein
LSWYESNPRLCRPCHPFHYIPAKPSLPTLIAIKNAWFAEYPFCSMKHLPDGMHTVHARCILWKYANMKYRNMTEWKMKRWKSRDKWQSSGDPFCPITYSPGESIGALKNSTHRISRRRLRKSVIGKMNVLLCTYTFQQYEIYSFSCPGMRRSELNTLYINRMFWTLADISRYTTGQFFIQMSWQTIHEFLKRDSQLKSCRGLPIEDQRTEVTKDIILEFFRRAVGIIDGVSSHFVVNIDEMGNQDWADRGESSVVSAAHGRDCVYQSMWSGARVCDGGRRHSRPLR